MESAARREPRTDAGYGPGEPRPWTAIDDISVWAAPPPIAPTRQASFPERCSRLPARCECGRDRDRPIHPQCREHGARAQARGKPRATRVAMSIMGARRSARVREPKTPSARRNREAGAARPIEPFCESPLVDPCGARLAEEDWAKQNNSAHREWRGVGPCIGSSTRVAHPLRRCNSLPGRPRCRRRRVRSDAGAL